MSKKQVFLKPTPAGQKAYDKLVKPFDMNDVHTAVGWDMDALFKDARKELKLKADDRTSVHCTAAWKDGQLLYRYAL